MPPIQRAFCRTAASSVAGKWPRLATTERLPATAGMRTNMVLSAKRAEPQAELIILGHASGGERAAVIVRREPGERVAGDGAADPGERDRRADRLAHDQLLAVALGEFVGNNGRRSSANRGSSSGTTGNCTSAARSTSTVEQRDLERVDEVLGIVQHDRLGGPALAAFVRPAAQRTDG